MAEVDWMREKTRQWPVLLLDETLAELDHERRQSLLEYVQNADQVLLTTTDDELYSQEFSSQCENGGSNREGCKSSAVNEAAHKGDLDGTPTLRGYLGGVAAHF